jgi:adenosylmethionine-8-amino-7-oxononanoate aminotransferase
MPSVLDTEVILVRGEGAYLWDTEGRRLLDVPASLWYCNIGHGRGEIADAVADQIRQLETYMTFGRFATPPALELADRVAAMVPIDNPKVFFGSGGSDAIETAAKLARRFWVAAGKPEKRIVATRANAYHGLHAFGTSIGGIDANRVGYGELVTGTERVDAHDPAALQSLVDAHGADAIAAFFCEPVMGTGGVYPPRPGYLDSVRKICRDNDILFVVDEVITGFGRAGAAFASERFDLDPDIMILAKGITSGYQPLGAAVVAERVWAPFWDPGSDLVFRHGITYAGHAAACAAALVNLDILEREQLVDRVRLLESVLLEALQPLEASEHVREVRGGVGLLAGVQCHDPALADRVVAECLDRGLLMRVITEGTIQISPPFVIEEHEIETIAAVLGEALDAVPQAAV